MSKNCLAFQAEIKQLLHLVTHSLYSNREIFLRELISNASDAADKLRFEAIAHPEYYEKDSELKIWIAIDAKAKTLTVRDNGIGMSEEEVINNLGTIAKSGTKEFLATLEAAQAKDAKLIGQFGVGFYSSFVVAQKVVVKTRRAGLAPEEGVEWESDGAGEFSVEKIVKNERGTEIILYLSDESVDLLDYWKIRQIVTKYSDHITLPIVMQAPAIDGEKEPPKPEVVNQATALWAQPKSQITDSAYQEFYRHISHDFDEPLLWDHHNVEGNLEYTELLYIPKHAPFDFWTRERKHGLKLYVQRVFIMDNVEQLLPNYLRFVTGIIDAKDLPLNVSRELLQNNKVIEQIKAALVKRILGLLENLAEKDAEKYAIFWSAFGNALKEGLVEDFNNRDRLAKLLRFASTKNDDNQQNVSFDAYLERMRPEQEQIFYLTAEDFTVAHHSPYLEAFRKHDLEVLLLCDRVDEWWLARLPEYQGKKLQSIAKGEVDLSKFKNAQKTDEKAEKEDGVDLSEVITKIKNILGDKVAEVRQSQRLTDSPVCMVTSDQDLSFNLQRIMADFGQNLPAAKPILELNPQHPLIKKLPTLDETALTEWSNFLYEEALLLAGGKLTDVAEFAARLNRLLNN